MKKKLILSLTLLLGLGLAWFLHIPEKILNIEHCHPSESFYLDEQVIKDQDKLEGYFEKLQDKQKGEKQHCWSYRHQKTITRVLKQPTPSIVKIGTKKFQDPQLLAMAPSAGIRHSLSTEPVSLYYVDNYTDHALTTGQYNVHKKAITVKSGVPLSNQHVILAHEYLHYVWYRDKLDQDIKLVGELTTFYKNSHDLQFRMKDYTSDMTKPTEFFSFGCTEFTNRHLTPYIVDKCNQYIDRSKLRMFYQ